jgi:hypothetical protein
MGFHASYISIPRLVRGIVQLVFVLAIAPTVVASQVIILGISYVVLSRPQPPRQWISYSIGTTRPCIFY